MKLLALTAGLFAVISGMMYADDAPVVPTQSGGVIPVHEEYIRLESEVIDIYLDEDEYQVEVRYVFENQGPATAVTMGFPNESDWMYGRSIQDFRAWVDDTEQDVYSKLYRRSSKPYGEWSAPDYFYECFDTVFAAGQSRIIRNSYNQQYVVDYNFTSRRAKYVLTTGAFWRDDIASIVVRIHHVFRESELRARTGYFPAWSGEEMAKFEYAGVEISPKPTRVTEGMYEITLYNIEPDFDIEISLPPPVVAGIIADSELGDPNYSYAPENVLDNDPETSWVEGETGPGIGKSVELYLSASTAGGKESGAYAIEAVGMMNGYAASQGLYFANNRVRRATLTYQNHIEGSYSEDSVAWLLTETTEMQWYRFDRPVLMSALKITIDDVYPGSRYDDTCIAEIVVVPARVDD